MPRHVLTDLEQGLYVEQLHLTPAELGLPAEPAWSVVKATLRGGRRDGVDLVHVDNGALRFSVCPTRGLNLWNASYKGTSVGWQSPVKDGPVHPAFVDLNARGGLGWLIGFDELMARCGLENNGAPYQEDAGGRATIFPLHGRISNLPAHKVALHVEEQAPHAITVEGTVDEAQLYMPQLRLTSKVTTEPGSNRLTLRDEVTNLHDEPGEFQLLYHWNFGPPHLDEGARLVAPVEVVCPRDDRAVEGLGHYDIFGAPEPGFTEQVYFFRLHAGDDGRTVVLLRNRAGDKGVALRYDAKQLPCFTLWKSTQGPRDGYVTGLEPGVNYPNPRPVEKERGRVVALEPGASHSAETTLEVLDNAEAVAAVAAEVERLQSRGRPTIHGRPVEPFVPEG